MRSVLRWTFHLANVLVAGSGIVLAVMIYLMAPTDQWSVVNHPWQPLVQHAHVLAAPLMVFVFGVLWAVHVWPRLSSRAPEKRRTGLMLVAMTSPMVASGYFLQVVVEPQWRTVWALSHLIVSILWLVVVGLHVVSRVGRYV